MANIRVDLDHVPVDGQPVTFSAPCNCNEITGLKVYYPDGSKVFTFKDAHKNTLTGIGNLFSKGAYVKAVLDTVGGNAYLQNADTNAYLEAALAGKAPDGYGLGVISYNSQTVTDANDAYRNGWYRLDGKAANGIGYASTLRVEAYSPDYVVQTVYRHTDSAIATWRRYGIKGTWTEWEDISPVVGYGLGASTVETVDLNNETKCGWKAFTNTAANRPFDYGTVMTMNRYGSQITQIAFNPYMAGQGQIAIRHRYQDVWREWEYLNPPMLNGTEYRTTERVHGKVVYKKADSNGSISYRLDGETAWYPERTQIIKLWQNGTPTSTFAKQTVSLDLSKYQMVAIEYRYNTSDDFRKIYFGNVGSTMALDVVSTSGYLGWRSATVSTTGISFSAAAFNGNDTVVGYVIPVAIYGIKGVC